MTLPAALVLAFAKAVGFDADEFGAAVDAFCFFTVLLIGFVFARAVVSEFLLVDFVLLTPTLDTAFDAVLVVVKDCDRAVIAFL